MGEELTNLLEIFKKFEKDGRQATLSIATNAGKTKIRLELDLSLSPAEPTPPASGGQRHRRRGPAKKAKAKARAALHQATLASASAADPVARGEEHVPVLKTPEKELSSPPIADLNRPLRKPFKCEQCDFSSDTKRGLSVHIGKAHRPEQAIEHSLLFDCQFCDGEECVQETNDRRLVCDHCDNVLYSSS